MTVIEQRTLEIISHSLPELVKVGAKIAEELGNIAASLATIANEKK